MSNLSLNTYKPPSFLFSKHLETIYPKLFRKIKIDYTRERIITPDDDFLDLDWVIGTNNHVVLLAHGLEGHSDESYIKGMARAFHEKGYTAVAMNFRGCSGEPNKKLHAYHAGLTEDIEFVISHIHQKVKPTSIIPIGFSLGGSILLSYLGRKGTDVHPCIKQAVAISVPCDLNACIRHLNEWYNFIYQRRFLGQLKEKAYKKAQMGYTEIDVEKVKSVKTIQEFDDEITAPLYGFVDGNTYRANNSCKQHLSTITVNTLIINALNDPFLTEECYPFDEAQQNKCITLDTPEKGGHVGFVQTDDSGKYWHEKRVLAFINHP